jgi:hypothetical protein
MKSIGTMITQLFSMTDTKDLSEWENDFVKSIVEQTNGGASTKSLTPKQVEIIDRLNKKHFA